jgi:hypothetical protein
MRTFRGVLCAGVGTVMAIFAAGVCHMSGLSAREQVDQQARDVWEKAVAAKGGRERLTLVRNAFRSCRAVKPFSRRGYRGLNARHDAFFVFPDKYWIWEDDRPSPFGLEIIVHNGERDITWHVTNKDRDRPRESATSEVNKYALIGFQLIYLLETAWVKPEPVKLGQGMLRGRHVDTVDAIWKDYLVKYSLDSSTRLALKVWVYQNTQDGGQRDMTAVPLGNYSPVSGIQMPESKGSGISDDTTPYIRCTTELNVEYDETVFEHPPRIEDGPEAWRPRLGDAGKKPSKRMGLAQ